MAGVSMGSLGTAVVEVGADFSHLQRDLDKGRSIISSTMGSLGGIAAGYLTFQTLTTVISAAWREAGNAATALAQVEARIRSTGGAAGVSSLELQLFAKQLQAITIFGDDATLQMEGMLLSFTNIRGDIVKEATIAIQDMTAAFKGLNTSGDDLQQTAIQVGKALQDPVEGVTALQRVGVRLTEQQKELVASLVDVGDTAGAQRVILAELNKEFGGTAEALRQTPWGEASALAATFGDTLELLGGTIGDTLHPAFKAMNASLREFNEGYLEGGWFKGLAKYLTDSALAALGLKNNIQGAMVAMGSGGAGAASIPAQTSTTTPSLPLAFKPNFQKPAVGLVDANFGMTWRDVVWPADDPLAPVEVDFEHLGEVAKDQFDAMEEFSRQAAQSIQSAFADFLFDPFENGVEGMLTSLRRIASNVLARQILGQIPGWEKLLGSKDGNVFSGGSVVPFAHGGVVNVATLFPMRRGIGLMGEAGPEAIMPLSRGGDGKLGVKASGMSVRIVNAFDDGHIDNYLRSSSGERVVLNIIQRNAGTVQRMIG